MHTRHHWQKLKWKAKIGQRSLWHWGEMEPNMLPWSQNCGTQLDVCYYKELNIYDTNYLIIFDQNLVEFLTSQLR